MLFGEGDGEHSTIGMMLFSRGMAGEDNKHVFSYKSYFVTYCIIASVQMQHVCNTLKYKEK